MTDRAPGLTPAGLPAAGPRGAGRRWSRPAAGTAGRCSSRRLRAISRLNDWVGEKILLSPTRLAPEYPIGARTPDAAVPGVLHHAQPNRAAFRSRPGEWALEVGGLVRTPMRLTRPMLEAAAAGDLHREAPLRRGLDGDRHVDRRAGLRGRRRWCSRRADARYLRFDSFDSRYYNGWDLASAMHPQTILAYAYNDRPLMAEHGAPLRLYSPIKLGYKLTKYLTAMTFTRERPGGYWEDQGYPWLGGI